MLTITYRKVQDYDSDWNPIYEIHGFGLSTDTKPTEGVGNGSAFLEMDTGKIYFYDAENTTWREWGA